jgi:dTDP-4-dehydrorhamnose reductase
MLGSMVARVLAADGDLNVTGTLRHLRGTGGIVGLPSGVRLAVVDAERSDEAAIASVLKGARWAVNAIGFIKPHIRETSADDIERALRVNALFPHRLARAAATCGTSVLQIATDCVYSGARGGYVESSPHDALDVYGKTKSLGEVREAHVHHLRTSIVGLERNRGTSLLEWFRGQPRSATVQGFTTHLWNGVTTLHFARVCAAIVSLNLDLPHRQHLVPADTVTKYELLNLFRHTFRREDILIQPIHMEPSVDRTLGTDDEACNRALWAAAGYPRPPAIGDMIDELAGVAAVQPDASWLAAS